MGIIARLKQIFNLSVDDPKAWNPSLWNLIGSQSLSGENVTEETALTYSAVWNAIELIAGTIASLPLDLYQGVGKNKRIADDYKLWNVMHNQWNPLMSAKVGRQTQIAHVLTWGVGYAEIVRNTILGDVVQLWPITPNRVIPRWRDNKIVYEIRVGSETVVLPSEQVLRIIGPSFDGFTGYSRIAMARKSIGLGMAMESFGALYFGQGTHPGVIVTHPGHLTQDGHKNLQTSLAETYSGLGQSHRLLLLEEGMKFESIGIPPEDSQFLQSRQFSIPEIARWFNVPPHKLKDLTRSSFNNITSEQGSFYTDSLLPWLVQLEQVYNSQLLTEYDRNLSGRGRLYFKHNATAILRAEPQARAEYYRQLWSIGAITINEIRELEEMPPHSSPEADELFVPVNMMPLSKAGEPPENKPLQQEALPPAARLALAKE